MNHSRVSHTKILALLCDGKKKHHAKAFDKTTDTNVSDCIPLRGPPLRIVLNGIASLIDKFCRDSRAKPSIPLLNAESSVVSLAAGDFLGCAIGRYRSVLFGRPFAAVRHCGRQPALSLIDRSIRHFINRGSMLLEYPS